MFTDWTQTDPHYFYLRGAIMGCVMTLLVVMPIINKLWKRLRRTANGGRLSLGPEASLLAAGTWLQPLVRRRCDAGPAAGDSRPPFSGAQRR